MNRIQEFLRKRFLNIPVMYWLAAGVIALAIFAWRLKPATTEEVGDTGSDPGAEGGLNDPTTADYDNLLPSGTVIVQPQPKPAEEAVQQTNESWAQSAIQLLIDDDQADPGDAQTAIMLYLQGAELTIDQAKLRDYAIRKLKIPPEPIDTVGTTKPQPARRQFTNFPGKHTVKGNDDNTPEKLSALYYGSGKWKLGANKIVQFNHTLGPATTTYPVGTTITIPEWREPVYYTATATTNTAAKIAARYKPNLTAAMVNDLNPGMSFPVKPGTKVRVL